MGIDELAVGKGGARRALAWVIPVLLVCALVAITAEGQDREHATASLRTSSGGATPSWPGPPELDTLDTGVTATSPPPTPATPTTAPRRLTGDRASRPVASTIRPPAVHPPVPPPVPEPTVTTIPDPPGTPPATVVERCAALPVGRPFAVPDRPDLYVVDARTSTAVSLAPGFSIGGASWSPAGDRVAFSGRQSGGTHGSEPTTLWVARVDGSAIARIAADAAYPSQPAWSPDGKYIAYYSTPWDGEGRLGLYLLDVARGESRLVARVDGGGFPMEWSPDGRHLALPAPNEDAVTIVDVGDGSVRDLAVTTEAYEVAWSPLGDRLLVSDLEGPVRVVRVVDGSAETVVPDGRYGRWSPKDERITVWRSFDAHVVDVRTGKDDLIATGADPIGWSSGSELVSLAIGTKRVDVVDVASRCRRSIVTSTALDVGPAAWSPTADAVLVVAESTGARRY